MIIVIRRNIFIPHDAKNLTMEGCTLGILKILDTDFFCWTVERPWVNNEPGVSCIPEGMYELEFVSGLHKKGAEWVVQNVPGRSAIEFHVANRSSELRGCISLGSRPYMFGTELGVTQSMVTTARFNETLEPFREDNVKLIITKGTMS